MMRFLPLVLLGMAMPARVFACAACFGRSDSEMAAGLNAGIAVLLGFVVVFWGLFGSFFLYIVRRSRRE